MRAAVYSGTRNIYEQMLTSAKSLLMHSNVEKIYFLIEDDCFPYTLPKEIECINISNQTYFNHDGPNFKNVLSYMVLIRVAYTKIFPDLDRILSIDVDTIVNENISDLWELDLTNYYLAAVEEIEVTKKEGSYINMGVAMLNLQKIRNEHKDDELIDNLNTYWYRWNEQDAINQLFRGNILILPNDYNACWQAGMCQHEKITHFAGIYDLEHFPNFDYYKNLPIESIKRNIQDKITLDIIIPTYKNKMELKRTLNSIHYTDDINIIVVDDCSDISYADIQQEFPYINFYTLQQNSGPGCARQFGIEHSNGTYIMFLDTGDYFYEQGLQTILNQIKKNTYIKMYSFSYVYDKNNKLLDMPDDKMISKIYNRRFIEMYNIHFSKEGSYANEDYGFNRTCKMIFLTLEGRKFPSPYKHIKIPVVYEHYDKNSITKRNSGEYLYTKMINGIYINTVHAINTAKPFNITPWMEISEICRAMAYEYYIFLCIVNERPSYVDDAWKEIKQIYYNLYHVYSKFAEKTLKVMFSQITLSLVQKRNNNNWTRQIPLNIIRFIHELETEEYVPIRYY